MRLTNERDGSLYRAQHAADRRAGAIAQIAGGISGSRNKFSRRNATNFAKSKESGTKSPIKSAIGNRLSILARSLTGSANSAPLSSRRNRRHIPRSLREIHAPPIVLYVWGELQERDHHAIGIIGARRTTHYGTESAKKLAYQLAYAGLTVISGLARGIDTAAHQGALAAKGRTIAVIGSGLAKLYPPENARLLKKFAAGNGAIVSEFSMEIEPDRQTFPMRNRIISGWSHGILVVEAGLNSGALITASQALEQGSVGLRCAWPHQRAERDGIQSPDSARRQASHGCQRHSG